MFKFNFVLGMTAIAYVSCLLRGQHICSNIHHFTPRSYAKILEHRLIHTYNHQFAPVFESIYDACVPWSRYFCMCQLLECKYKILAANSGSDDPDARRNFASNPVLACVYGSILSGGCF